MDSRDGELSVRGLVFPADGDDDDTASLLVHFVEYAMVTACPDAKLPLAAADLVVPSRAGILLQVQDRSGDTQEGIVVQFEQFALGRPPEPDPKHGSS